MADLYLYGLKPALILPVIRGAVKIVVEHVLRVRMAYVAIF